MNNDKFNHKEKLAKLRQKTVIYVIYVKILRLKYKNNFICKNNSENVNWKTF